MYTTLSIVENIIGAPTVRSVDISTVKTMLEKSSWHLRLNRNRFGGHSAP